MNYEDTFHGELNETNLMLYMLMDISYKLGQSWRSLIQDETKGTILWMNYN